MHWLIQAHRVRFRSYLGHESFSCVIDHLPLSMHSTIYPVHFHYTIYWLTHTCCSFGSSILERNEIREPNEQIRRQIHFYFYLYIFSFFFFSTIDLWQPAVQAFVPLRMAPFDKFECYPGLPTPSNFRVGWDRRPTQMGRPDCVGAEVVAAAALTATATSIRIIAIYCM